MNTTLRNSVTVESPYGLRTFALRSGDVTLAPDPVLVVPTHAYDQYVPDGRVLAAATKRFGVDFQNTERIISGRKESMGTLQLRERGSFRGHEILLVRIPGQSTAERASDNPLELLSEALWSLFGSLAALELRTSTLTSLAMPLLAGSRGYPVRDLLRVIMDHSLAWLRVSRYMNAVNFYLLDPKAAAEWDGVMDDVLGRHSVDSAQSALVNALRGELLSLLTDKVILDLPGAWQEVMTELHATLQLKKLPLERIAVGGRRVAELLVGQLLTLSDGEHPKGNLGPQLEALKNKKQIAPWIVAHLEALKHFGNAAAHSNQAVSYDPPSLRDEDMVGLLASLQRIIEFVIHNSRKV